MKKSRRSGTGRQNTPTAPSPVLDTALQHHQSGRLAEAEALYRKILQAQPGQPDALHLSGLIAYQQGRHECAAALIRQAIARSPSAPMYCNLGLVLQAQGQLDEAIDSYRQALALMPDYPEAHNNLGTAYKDRRQADAAIDCYRNALASRPDYAEAHANLGNLLKDLGRLEPAVESYGKALALQPHYVEALNNLGLALHALGHSEAASESYRRAIALQPSFVTAHYNLATVLQNQGRLNDAIACLRQALHIKPDFVQAHSTLIFNLDMAAGIPATTLQEERRRWDAMHAAPLAALQRAHSNVPDPQRRLRIGYVSADFVMHSAAAVFGTMLTRFDRSQFDVYAYSNTAKEDAYTGLFRQQVSHWRNIVDLSDEAAAELIRQDGIDILVDLSGHSAGNRLLLFARKPAPIQITAWGYATSTGMRAIDAFFADPVIVPPEEKPLFTEEVRYLPSVVSFFSGQRFPAPSALPALSAPGMTFGSFNRLGKISEQTFATWGQILGALPGSRLILKTAELDDAATQGRIAEYFLQAGIARERIIMLGRTPWEEHMAAFHQVDIALDPFPHGGGVTTLEGLMMGIPVVTLRCQTIVGRLSASILTTLGLTDWIAESPQQYVDLVLGKAADLAALKNLRPALRERLLTSVIGNQAAYLAAVEQEYRSLWQRWCHTAKETATPVPAASLAEALVHHQAGRLMEAEIIYREILRQQPDHADALHLLGALAQQRGDNVAAAELIGRAIALQPGAQMCYNRGVALQALDRLDAAIEHYRQAIALQPDLVKAHSNLGAALQNQGRLEEAIACHRQTLQIKPDYSEAHSNLIFALDMSAQVDTQRLQEERRRWNAQHALALTRAQQPHANSAEADRRLRIGYVSADFRGHSAPSVFGAMLLQFDHKQFEVFAYSNTKNEDAYTQLFAQRVTCWRNIVDLSDDAIADLIRADGIDILIDLSSHSAGNRLLVFARKPAPIQITAWGYATSTGLSAMDVFFADPVIVPEAEKQLFTEEVRYLPNVVSFFSAMAYPPVNQLPALSRKEITFGSFNRLTKISEQAYAVWAQILHAVPHSRLLMKTAELSDAATCARITAYFSSAGIAPERIVLLGRTSWGEHVAAFNQVDLGLDPFPHGGGVTTLEGLMMGIPVVTLRWNTIVGRLSASILTTLELTDWIADTTEQYVQIAVDKARDLAALNTLRLSLRERLSCSVIGDTAAYVAAVEQEYRALWQRWCAQKNPLPSFAEALALHQTGQLTEAQAMYQAILRQQPDHADALHLLGTLAGQQGDHAGAAAFIRRAIDIQPSAQMHYNLGVSFQAIGNLDTAVEHYRQAVALKPDDTVAWCNLGTALQAQEHLDAAIAAYHQAIALKPDYAEAHNNLGNALQMQGKLDVAADCLRQALHLQPQSLTHSNLIFTLDLMASMSAADLQEERRNWNAIHAAPLLPAQLAHAQQPEPQRRLRIGYVSADFRAHSAVTVFGPMLLHFNSDFEVFAYSNSKKQDATTEMFRQRVNCWRNIADLSDEAAAELIRADGIDILVDLSGHSAGNRLLVFARKPAPIQITAWGYATSTGLEAMDVFFADPVIVPEEEKPLLTEEVRYLPSIVPFFSTHTFPAVKSAPALAAHAITFGSFNRLAKISEPTFQVWSQILRALPGSRLLLKAVELGDAGERARILGYFTTAGVAAERITLLGRTTWEEHVASFHHIDIALDPFPHGGGVTTLEGLMMGIPVVTLRWNTIVGRLSASILTTLELTDWIADTTEQYVQIAVDKARDLAALNTLRLSLRERLSCSVIGDTAAYVAAVEQEYRALWQRWCAASSTPAPSLSDALAEHQTGHLTQARAMYQAILRQQPDHADALHLLGALAQQEGDHAAAVEYISRAIRIKPSAQMHYNLGVALQAQENLDAAIENYRQAVALKPDYVDAWSNLGSTQQAQDNLDAAVESYRHALALQPNLSACNNLGSTLNAQGKIDEAIACYRQALALDPNCVKAWSNLGGTLQSQGKLDEAIAHFRRALEIKPEYFEAHSNLIFTLDLAAQCDTAALQEERKRWDAAHAAPLLPRPLVHRNLPQPQRRLRIGYVSGDFKIHSAAAVFGAMLLHFNRAQFEVFAYSNAKTEDDYTRMFAQQVTHWRQISDLSDAAIADLIRADNIDILVDLSSHSAGNRLLVFARKPAPIQITAWGYATSTGLSAMDVFFADPVIVPEAEKQLFTEEIRYLPNVVSFFSAMAYPPVNQLPALSRKEITFGSFNRLTKISEQAYAVWAQILHAVPHSRLLMKTAELSDAATCARITAYFSSAGIAPDRIVLLGRTSWGEHVAAFNQVDLGLDPFPHGGGVTTLEGLMMGIPVVTLRWNTIVGRLSASILTTLELTDWIADTTEQYVQIAVDKARDLAALNTLRLSLRERLSCSVIGDTAAYVAAVEQEYRALWQRWCAEQNPAPAPKAVSYWQ